MSYKYESRLYDENGILQATAAAVTSSSGRGKGLSFDVDGRAHISFEGTPVTKHNGIAYDSKGVLCLTLDTPPASGDYKSDGVLVRADGVVYAAISQTTAAGDYKTKLGRVDSRGVLYVNIPPWTFPFLTYFWDAAALITQGNATERASAWLDRIAGTSLASAAGANDPIVLPYSGTNYCWNAAVAANNLSTANKSVTGSFRQQFDIAAADYTPGSNITLATKLSGNDGFEILLLTTGVIRLRIGDGASVTNVDSTVATGITDFVRKTLRIDWNDGVGGAFYVDGVQLGSSVAAVKTLTNAATAYVVGPWDGKLYSYSLTNQGATTYYGKDLTTLSEGSANFTDDTGATVTFNSTGAKPAQIVGSQQLLFDGSAFYMDAATGNIAQPFSLIPVWRLNTHSNGPIALGSSAGGNSGIGLINPSPTMCLYAGTALLPTTNGATLKTTVITGAVMNGASSTIQTNLGSASTDNPGSAGITTGLRIGANVAANAFANVQVKAITLCNTALTTARNTQLISACRAWYAVP